MLPLGGVILFHNPRDLEYQFVGLFEGGAEAW